MDKRLWSLSRDEIRAKIFKMAREKTRTGMPADQAISEAGAEFREMQRRQGEHDVANVQNWLGGSRRKDA